MKEEIKNYSDALEAHIQARKQKIISDDLVKKTRYALIVARDILRGKEQDIMSDMERI